ncbi:MAG: signal peptidase II, partial [Candidatus Aerophobetes bacterium]|nr:signal peptidase II [Candidatus Aerophobetes bacterium]
MVFEYGNIISVLFVLLLFIADQVVKEVVISCILPGSSIPIITEFIYLTPVKNQGLVMGFFPGPFHLSIFLPIFLIMVFIFLWLLKFRKRASFGMSFIIAG